MSMSQYTLDGSTMRSLDDLYAQLSIQVSLAEHFGSNLDALWDVLSTDVEGPFTIMWKHAEDSKKTWARTFNVQ